MIKKVDDIFEESLKWMGDKMSSLPCERCGGPVVEFSIDNDIWNSVMRPDGHESNNEYICYSCWKELYERFYKEMPERINQQQFKFSIVDTGLPPAVYVNKDKMAVVSFNYMYGTATDRVAGINALVVTGYLTPTGPLRTFFIDILSNSVREIPEVEKSKLEPYFGFDLATGPDMGGKFKIDKDGKVTCLGASIPFFPEEEVQNER